MSWRDASAARILATASLLEWAVTEDRILVTIDGDFGEFVFRERTPHAGLIRLPDVPAPARIAEEQVNPIDGPRLGWPAR
jgi:predicted nuclease of predicted toxin-antitoxin system